MITLVCSCKSKDGSRDKPLVWNRKAPLAHLSYGLPKDMRTQNVQSVLSKKWGLTDKSVAGCVVTKSLTDSVTRHNRKVDDAMDARFGNNWRKQYKQDYNHELVVQNKAIALLNQEPLIIKKRNQLKKEHTDIQIFLDPTPKPAVYNAMVSCYESQSENPRYVQVYQYEVNVDKPAVRLLNDPFKPLQNNMLPILYRGRLMESACGTKNG
ncbi:hypothetical protein [Mucilaginibacter sp. CSA2-8R]|uniref:FEKKY domain-containing protein n=1 Tax=Mucilaginibacter sp. CSA2-8R TaxID=3141542 RepID=UPI00315D509D